MVVDSVVAVGGGGVLSVKVFIWREWWGMKGMLLYWGVLVHVAVVDEGEKEWY